MRSIDDTFLKGYIAGLVASVATTVVDLISYSINFTQVRYLDFASIIMFERFPTTTNETVFAQAIDIFWQGFLGTMFALIITKVITPNYLKIKGWLFGTGVWFAIYGASRLFSLPALGRVSLQTSFSHFITASVFGLVLAYSYEWLTKVSTTENEPRRTSLRYRLHPVPAKKQEQKDRNVCLEKRK